MRRPEIGCGVSRLLVWHAGDPNERGAGGTHHGRASGQRCNSELQFAPCPSSTASGREGVTGCRPGRPATRSVSRSPRSTGWRRATSSTGWACASRPSRPSTRPRATASGWRRPPGGPSPAPVGAPPGRVPPTPRRAASSTSRRPTTRRCSSTWSGSWPPRCCGPPPPPPTRRARRPRRSSPPPRTSACPPSVCPRSSAGSWRSARPPPGPSSPRPWRTATWDSPSPPSPPAPSRPRSGSGAPRPSSRPTCPRSPARLGTGVPAAALTHRRADGALRPLRRSRPRPCATGTASSSTA